MAGGECEGIQRSLRSAEMYDPNRNKWCAISDMSTAMVPFIGVVYGGRSVIFLSENGIKFACCQAVTLS